VRKELYKDASGVLLVYDTTDAAAFKRLGWWVDELRSHGSGSTPVILVVGNKTDLAGAREVSEGEGRKFAAEYGLPHAEASAATGDGVDEVFALLLARALAAHPDASQGLVELAEREYEEL